MYSQHIHSSAVPAELIKARMQTQGFSNLGLCLRDAVARERGGFMGLYTGYAATMVRDLPYFALQLGFYGEPFIAQLQGRRRKKSRRLVYINLYIQLLYRLLYHS